jgi:hypothetical protein
MKPKHTEPRPPGLSPAIEALLEHERVPPAQPDAVRERVVSRAQKALLQSPSAPPPPRGTGTSLRRVVIASVAGIAVVAAVVTAFHLVGRPAPRGAPSTMGPPAASTLAAISPPTDSAAAASPALEALTPAASSASSALAPETAVSSRPVPASRPDAAMGELELLTRARQADARGDYVGALALLSEHERRYPAGRLSEEREVLRVKALVALGRADEARRAGARFHRRFPHSVLLQKVDEMEASLP